MSWFDTFIAQPIFNILIALYAIIPGNDFGVSLVIFAVLFRLLMWPLIRKQLHQTKLQREIQPELKKIKKKAKGNKQLAGQMMLELHRERGVNPFAPFGVLLIQLPIFIALFNIITKLAADRQNVVTYTYAWMADVFKPVADLLQNPESLNENFLGLIDLTQVGVGNNGIYWPLIIMVLIAALLQYYQSKQLTPVSKDQKRLRDILKESAAGVQADQADISAAMSRRMVSFIPFMTFGFFIFLPGALVLFYTVSSLVAVVQQSYVLKEDVEDMEEIASEPSKPSNRKKVSSTVVTPAKKTTKKQAHRPKKSKSSQKSKSAHPTHKAERSIPKPVQKRRKGSKVK